MLSGIARSRTAVLQTPVIYGRKHSMEHFPHSAWHAINYLNKMDHSIAWKHDYNEPIHMILRHVFPVTYFDISPKWPVPGDRRKEFNYILKRWYPPQGQTRRASKHCYPTLLVNMRRAKDLRLSAERDNSYAYLRDRGRNVLDHSSSHSFFSHVVPRCNLLSVDLCPFPALHTMSVFGQYVGFFKFVRQPSGLWIFEPPLPSPAQRSEKKKKVHAPIEWWLSCDLRTEEGRELFMERAREVAQMRIES